MHTAAALPAADHALWLAWALYWIVSAANSKTTRRRESPGSRLAHIVPLILGGVLLAGNMPWPWLARAAVAGSLSRLLDRRCAACRRARLHGVGARAPRQELERLGHGQGRPRADCTAHNVQLILGPYPGASNERGGIGHYGLMSLHTAFTELAEVEHPVALAPMGGCAGGAPAAAVSNAGGLGLVGGGRASLEWCREQAGLAARLTERPWGIGFLTWALTRPTLEGAFYLRPAAVMLGFGDPGQFSEAVRQSGALLVVQVTDLDEARRALDVGADVVVAQGTEAGGHGGRRSTFPFVPTVVDMAAPTPVLAAGGIADGRGLAAAWRSGRTGHWSALGFRPAKRPWWRREP